MSFIATICLLIANFGQASYGKDIVRIAAGEWPPYLSENMPGHGVAAQIITDIFAELGYQVEYRFLPWPRAFKEAKAGNFDGTAVWLKNDERLADFYYSNPVIRERHVLFHMRELPFSWESIQDLQGLKIGGILNFSYGDEFDKAEKSGKIHVDRTNTDVQNFRKLLAGRIQIYPQELQVSINVLQTNFSPEEVSRITYHAKPLMEKDSFLLLSKKIKRNQDLINLFNYKLDRLKESGKYQKYFPRSQEISPSK
ncbi:polar amino acid transport system substrate-binding protein [Chitinivorax tropicus]|uniref:Polar amino acid transport system substrate-binding protein n=1 Tax=Chitinivorax tropicus TaxID=714531 RepID=A0A840MDY3_9PROT|nr:transporter substrate-binding domain-containing protein [Chitinivorax tropicus]MBB5016888.1 polar amino acid transport system substrate-binding protein [Chitinivorax tropicus]